MGLHCQVNCREWLLSPTLIQSIITVFVLLRFVLLSCEAGICLNYACMKLLFASLVHIYCSSVQVNLFSTTWNLEESWYWGWTFIMQTGLLSNKGIAIIGWWNGAVQHECIPQAILGMDVICQAKSGMGKTAVFVLSTLQQIEPVTGQVAALVLCHTRELAYQVDHSFCIAELVCQDAISPSRFTVTSRFVIPVFTVHHWHVSLKDWLIGGAV